jgi:hypothetical protein
MSTNEFVESIYHSIAWHLWRRKVVLQWIDRMESARKLFPSGYGWSSMRATADVLATVQQKQIFYVSPKGARRRDECNSVQVYESQLIEILERQVGEGSYTRAEAREVADMLIDYSSVHSERCKAVLKALKRRI